MAKPKVFVSSTFYDLKYVREGLSAFIRGLGYDPVLFENGDIPFHHDKSLEDSCYAEVDNCHILVLIVGGRFGALSGASDEEGREKAIEKIKSVTQSEYEKARNRDIPIFIFVEKNVFAEHKTYVKNRDKNLDYAYVDNIAIYKMLDDILLQRRNNYVKEFETVETIISWLRDQWAGLLADFLSKKNEQIRLTSLSEQISSLQDVAVAIKNYSEEVVKASYKTGSSKIIDEQEAMLRKKMALRFSREGMLKYLKSNYDVTISPTPAFSIFEKSNTLDEFLTELGMSAKRIKEFEADVGEFAREDFSEMKMKYTYDAQKDVTEEAAEPDPTP